MAKKVLTTIKLQAPGGQASPAPPVGPALGQHGINIMEFVKAFNAQTANDMGTTIPVVITVYEDRSFTFITKTPPAAVLIRQAIGIEKGSGEPNRNKVGTITDDAGARDRREEARRPQRARRRPGGEDHRRHRPLDGRGGRGVMATAARATRTPARRSTATHEYTPAEAVKLVKELKRAKFDESVEIHVRTGLNVRHADEQLRGTIALPHGLGKDVTIAVFARGDKAREAEEAGADFVGAEDLAERIQNEGFTDFDVAIATPDMMPVVGRLGRILGPQGKMPNPKVGTVTMDVAQGRRGVQGRQGRVPHRPHRDRAPDRRQDLVPRRAAAGELPGGDRGAHPRQAVRGQGQVPAHDRHGLHAGAGRQDRSVAHP